ncbi:MAG: YraN family protein [Alphaproteobacteria bacterium]
MSVSPKRVQANKKGSWAENFAALYFLSKGYKILKRRYKTKGGEIDLVLHKKDMLVFVEVKARKTIEEALHAIHAKNRARIEAAAGQFISDNKEYAKLDMRLDAFCIALDKSIVPMKFVHLDNAWLSGA